MSRRHRKRERWVVNRPCAEGIALGEQMARLTDNAASSYPQPRDRCASCAFRRGTIPNGCLETVLDATKAVVEGKTFLCHMDLDADGNPQHVCAGWAIVRAALDDRGVTGVEVPWEYAEPAPASAYAKRLP